MQRRDLLRAAAAFAAAGMPSSAVLFANAANAATVKPLGGAERFDYAALKGRARALSQQPYKSHVGELPAEVAGLDWDAYQAIQYRPEHALWADDNLQFKAKFFHLGLFFKSPVKMYKVENGQAQEIAYDAAMFDYGKSGLKNKKLPKDLGFAGFRLNFHPDDTRDVAAFLGASYFRAVGGEWQYGLSARGLAIDCGAPTPEEFPNFTSYYLEKPAADSRSLTVYGLLDSASTTGAYRFIISPGATLTMDIDAALYPRKTIERLGIAPCTSMYQTGENDRRMANDWRPEIHDSDGLAMHTGAGEWIWRPLLNPRNLRFNAYQDENPQGFGLLQRDRNFDHYQDDGVFYDRRPSLWVEAKSGWGKGSVQLVEIPTADETFDNIVAFWNPAKKPQAGDELLFAYRLHWGGNVPATPSNAICVATYAGLGGVVGRKREYFSWRFSVDFSGNNLATLPAKTKVEAMVSVSRGKLEITSARPLESVSGYRAMFDVVPPDDSTTPIDIRLYLAADGKPLTETWLYQWTPPPKEERKLA